MAYLLEHAGGYASNGKIPILDVQPTALHQRVPLYMGSKGEVEILERFIREHEGEETPLEEQERKK